MAGETRFLPSMSDCIFFENSHKVKQLNPFFKKKSIDQNEKEDWVLVEQLDDTNISDYLESVLKKYH